MNGIKSEHRFLKDEQIDYTSNSQIIFQKQTKQDRSLRKTSNNTKDYKTEFIISLVLFIIFLIVIVILTIILIKKSYINNDAIHGNISTDND